MKSPATVKPFTVLLVVFTSAYLLSVASIHKLAHAEDCQESLLPPPKGNSTKPRIVTVFSTGCSPYQDWQSQALLHSHRTHGVEGELVRLMSCDNKTYELPKNSYARYRVVRTPDFNLEHLRNEGGIDYSPRNRPGAMKYWLSGQSHDKRFPKAQDVVVAVDPDQVFLDSHLDLSAIRPGHGIAATYDLTDGYLKKWGHMCKGKCESWTMKEGDYHPSFGHPQLFTASDALRHAQLWINVTNEMKRTHLGWETEMYSNTMATKMVGLQVQVQPLQASHPGSRLEPWQDMSWHRRPKKDQALFVGHYCQTYKIKDFTWYKGELGDLDIRRCPTEMQWLQGPSGATWEAMEASRNQPLRLDRQASDEEREKVLESRHVWILDHTWSVVREALGVYYAEFCQR